MAGTPPTDGALGGSEHPRRDFVLVVLGLLLVSAVIMTAIGYALWLAFQAWIEQGTIDN